jgi:oligopeptide/dipeptide ABC transporter ATP-binding protein
MSGTAETLLDVRGLTVRFPTIDGVVQAVSDISFTLRPGETLGIVGESGSGKSVSNLAIMGLLNRKRAIITGEILFNGRELLGLPPSELRKIRGKDIAMIFQDPFACLHPMFRVGAQIAEAATAHGIAKDVAHARAVELLDRVGIPNAKARARDYPHQFSGGMRQRAMIAMALVHNPAILIADEPTTALDVTVQAQVLETLKTARQETGAAMILITHDLGIVAGQADRVLVMYAGRAVEVGTVEEIFYTPRMPYTLGLLGSLPRLDRAAHARLTPITGVPPSLINMPPGCPFAPRCPMVEDICLTVEPPLAPTTSVDHVAACHFSDRLEGMEPADLFKQTTKDDALPADIAAAVPPGDPS